MEKTALNSMQKVDLYIIFFASIFLPLFLSSIRFANPSRRPRSLARSLRQCVPKLFAGFLRFSFE